jgi:A/G-specific adenine glycosylase
MNLPRFRRTLLDWYGKNRRRLPWRGSRDPYRIWVSEVMLQQTQVQTMLPYYRRFMSRFPRLRDLALADLEAVLKAWEGLGYYARARNLHRAAGLLAQQGSGRVPNDWQEFRSLPGVGDYIAAAVQSIAFNRPHAVVDGNVRRVLARLMAVDAPAGVPASRRVFQAAADRLLDRRYPGDFNQAMMELGALVCTPRDPQCGRCPIDRFCTARRSGTVALYPRRSGRPPVPEVRIAVGVIFKNDRLLVTRRPAQGLLGGLWEFPGGKLLDGETPESACAREVKEEVGLTVKVERHLAHIRHAYSHFRIRMDVFCCRFVSGRVRRKGADAHRWVRVPDLDRFPFPAANHKFIPLLKEPVSAGPGGKLRA